jgi:Cupin domain
MAKQIRRIVTGHNAAGRSIILTDGAAPNAVAAPFSKDRVSTLLWVTDRAPASNRGNEDAAPAGLRVPIAPPSKGGSIFRIAEFPPDSSYDSSQVDMTAGGAMVTADRSKKHFGFHKTNTVDYALCLEGEVWAVMDEGETLMKAGDVLIQRGTYHSWSNRSDKPCRMAFILIDAEPV